MLTLRRNAVIVSAITEIDSLNYRYDPSNLNQLLNITDKSGGSYAAAGFKNLTASSLAYAYDANTGNLKTDSKKGLSLNYNVLNKTDKITVTTGTNQYINYTYDASGILLRKQSYNNGALLLQTDYIDGFVYEGGTLAYFAMPEGRVRNNAGVPKFEFIITDNQGNARVSFEEKAGGGVNAIQENSYYPFGLSMNSSITPTAPNKNLYNGGAEWQSDYGNNPEIYATFYRNYDPALGRFMAIDPKADASASWSSYHYAFNNPILYNDPMGDYPPAEGEYISRGGGGALILQSNNGRIGSVSNSGGSDGGGSFFNFTVANPRWYEGVKAKEYQQAITDRARSGDMQAVREYAQTYGTTIYEKSMGDIAEITPRGIWVQNGYWDHTENQAVVEAKNFVPYDERDSHAVELAKYGQIVAAYNLSFGTAVGPLGGTFETGVVFTDKGWARKYKTVYYSTGFASPSVAFGFTSISPSSDNYLPTFSDWKGAMVGFSASFDFISGNIGFTSAYMAWGLGLSAAPESISFPFMKDMRGSGTANLGVTSWIGAPFQIENLNLPGASQRYIKTMQYQGGY